MAIVMPTKAIPEVYLSVLLQCLEGVEPHRTTNVTFKAQVKQTIGGKSNEELTIPDPLITFTGDDQLFLSNQDLTALLRALHQVEQKPLLEIVKFLQDVIDKRGARNHLWPEGRLQLGIAYAALEDYAEARRVLDKVIDLCKSGGQALLEEKSMLQQIYTGEELQDILKEAYYHLGRVLYAEGRYYNRAVSVLTQAVRLDEQNIPALYYLGQAIRAQIEQNLYKQAENLLRSYIQQGAPLGHENDVREFLRVHKKVTGVTEGGVARSL